MLGPGLLDHLAQGRDVHRLHLLRDLAGDEARGDRRSVEVQDRGEARRVDHALVDEQAAQLRVAVLLHHEQLVMVGDEFGNLVAEGKGTHAQRIEVKSLRAGAANLTDAYGAPKGGELYLVNAHIGAYGKASAFGHEPTRGRKILMHRAELDRWLAKVRERGYSIIPLVLYFKGGKAKVRLGLCTGKTHEDRRASIKERETQREIDRATRRR